MNSRTPAPEGEGPELRAEEYDRPTGTVLELSDPENEDAWIRSDDPRPVDA